MQLACLRSSVRRRQAARGNLGPPSFTAETQRLEVPEAVALQISYGQPCLLSACTEQRKNLLLLKAHKAGGGDRAKKLFQFLNEIGARALGRHLGRVLEMAESSADKCEYEAKIAQRFGFVQQLELPMPMPVGAKQEAAN
jgi:hypothetical protein